MVGRPSPPFLRPSPGYANFCKREGVTSSGVSQLRCLGSALPAFSTTVTGRANDRHSGRGVRPRRGFYLTEKPKQGGIKCPKGEQCPKQQGIWCPRRAAGFVGVWQCSWRKGPGKGRSPAAARAPLFGPGREGRRLLLAASSSSLAAALAGDGRPGILARRPCRRVRFSTGPRVRQLTSLVARESLNAPFLDPRGHQCACTGKETGLPRRGALGF